MLDTGTLLAKAGSMIICWPEVVTRLALRVYKIIMSLTQINRRQFVLQKWSQIAFNVDGSALRTSLSNNDLQFASRKQVFLLQIGTLTFAVGQTMIIDTVTKHFGVCILRKY